MSFNFTTTFSPLVNNIPTDINTIASYVTVIFGCIASLVAIFRYRPKASVILSTEFFDIKNNSLIQQKTYKISWGWGTLMFLHTIKLEKFPSTHTYKIKFKPEGSFERTLSPEYYVANGKKDKTILKIKNKCIAKKCFLMENDVTKISVITYGPSDSKVNSKIKVNQTSNTIEIFNENSIEVRNFNLKLNEEITADRLSSCLKDIQELNFNTNGKIEGFTIKTIPPIDATTPGKITIIY